MSTDTRYQRAFSVTTDQYGIDALKDKTIPSIRDINYYTPHVVTQEENGAPDLISYREYGREDLWWVILAYNGIASYRDIVQGTNLRIPILSSVITAVGQNTLKSGTTQRVIEI